MEHIQAHSYGVIPLYEDYNGYKVLIVQHANGGHWGFPKGTPEDGETPLQTAVRELQEETGIPEKDIRIESKTTFIEQYSFEQQGVKYDKSITYYIGFANEMTTGEHLADVTSMQWVSLEEVKTILTYKEALSIVNQLEEYIEGLQEYNW